MKGADQYNILTRLPRLLAYPCVPLTMITRKKQVELANGIEKLFPKE
jgi:hypothetical protein